MNKIKQRLPLQLLPTIIALAWPTMLEQVLNTAVQYVDVAMVSSLGTSATAAVGSTTTVNWLVGSSISALGIGFLSFIAKAIGANDLQRAKRAAGQAVFIVTVSGLIFTVITLSLSRAVPVLMRVDEAIRPAASEYFFIMYSPMLFRTANIIFSMLLRAAGDTKTPMQIGLAANILNVILNFILIYPTRSIEIFGFEFTVIGANLGVRGAALASAVAVTFCGCAVTIVLLKHKRISPLGCRFLPDKEILMPCLRVAGPNMLQRFGTSFGYVVFASMINSIGKAAVAAHTIANTIESAFYIPAYGMQTAAATLAGNAAGAKDKTLFADVRRMLLPIEIILMCLSGGLLFCFAPMLVGFFTDSEEVMRQGIIVLRMVALSEPFYGVAIILEGMLQGIGNTRRPFVFNIVGMWGVRIVGTFICTKIFKLGLVSAWGCMILHNLLLFILFCATAKNSGREI